MGNTFIYKYVYVITTPLYQARSLFKIGFSANVDKRMATFNATRMDDDLFFCVLYWGTSHYSKLEAFLHQHLKEYRRNNEFFEVPLHLIEEGVELFALSRGSTAFHGDFVYFLVQEYDIQTVNDTFTYTGGDEVYTKAEMADWVRVKLDDIDRYGLYRFLPDHVGLELIDLMRDICKRRDSKLKHKDVDSLSSDFHKIKIV